MGALASRTSCSRSTSSPGTPKTVTTPATATSTTSSTANSASRSRCRRGAAVGTRAGLVVAGAGLPGHFVARASDPSGHDILFDPFNGGQFLDAAGCEELVSAVTGRPFELTAKEVAATPPGMIAVRMLNNLKRVYLRDSDVSRAARVMGRLVQLGPDDPRQRRDLGVSLVHAGQPGRAIDHPREYLDGVPTADDADAVRGFLDRATAEVARWN
jgi:regulator of sirC expression with transglutaminase-like and TPR domain